MSTMKQSNSPYRPAVSLNIIFSLHSVRSCCYKHPCTEYSNWDVWSKLDFLVNVQLLTTAFLGSNIIDDHSDYCKKYSSSVITFFFSGQTTSVKMMHLWYIHFTEQGSYITISMSFLEFLPVIATISV